MSKIHEFPKEYKKEHYIDWHCNNFPQDVNFEQKLATIVSDVKVNSKEPLRILAKLNAYILNYCSEEYNSNNNSKIEYYSPLTIENLDFENHPLLSTLFKSNDSIINKMWRINKNTTDKITLDDLPNKMNDLVRTEVISSTLQGANYYAKKMGSHMNFIHDKVLKDELAQQKLKIHFNPRMYMDKGYFAYHGNITFRNGIQIEIQSYSDMMTYWRKLNHVFYEKLRNMPGDAYDFGETRSRLISLGHLLHLAECEILRIESELENLK